MTPFKFGFLCYCFLPFAAVAQVDTVLKPSRLVELNYDNDFFSATDRYYTQGIYLKFASPFIKKSPVSKLLMRLYRPSVNDYSIQLEQDVFTPRSIRHEGIYYGERPFTALLFIRHECASSDLKRKQRLITQLDLGVLGPYAKGEEEQKGIHKALNNIQPLGWENQLSTDIIINYNIGFEKGLIEIKFLQWMALGEIKLGTLYDQAGAGTLLRLGWMRNYFEGSRLVSPTETRKWECYVFGKVMGKAVGYNATLQGGLFNKDIYALSTAEVKRGVATAYTGLVLSYKNVRLEYTNVFISPEIENGLTHGWGNCAITVYF
ncbi:MAG TPA: lipid A deacylase LpxR family protein [Bacteroidia bacterium]|jgi:hypothetical protein|nr:lipid A deacylase LpxR family protein [Bacteroidia bacterium]HRG52459.1 lipid A deacylase LpxR family protein [Bacteroidia bacterium]